MKKSTRISGLVGILLVSITAVSNEVPLNTKQNFERTPPISSETNVQTPQESYGSGRLDKKTLDEFINSIYKNIKISEVIDKKFIKSIVNTESERHIYAESEVGARGLMQIMPNTWNEIGEESDFYKEAFNPHKNLTKGIKYLDQLNTYCEQSFPGWFELSIKNKQITIAAAYNGGIGRLMRNNWDIDKMPEETRLYVKKVENNFNL